MQYALNNCSGMSLDETRAAIIREFGKRHEYSSSIDWAVVLKVIEAVLAIILPMLKEGSE